ncbi:MAG: hypothetical protein NC115_05780 [Bacteroidales bacterium]|nr:hypothetical protein [Bacteroidales bacterium]
MHNFADLSPKWTVILSGSISILLFIGLLHVLFGKVKRVRWKDASPLLQNLWGTVEFLTVVLATINLFEKPASINLILYFCALFVFLIYIGFQIYLVVAKKIISFRD